MTLRAFVVDSSFLNRRPRMVSVQSAACAPMVRAFEGKLDHAPVWEDPQRTSAFGLRVPGALGDFLILRALYASNGTAIAIAEEELLQGARDLATQLGLQVSPEGGACLAAARRLKNQGWLHPDDQIVLFNTGHGLKYT